MGYLNLVGSFVYKDPVFRSKLSALANNDAQLKTDGWAQSTKAVFYQAAVPVGWTQDASQNDVALRLVGSTGGGVSGGTHPLSTSFDINHTHSLSTPSDGSHTHAFSNHTHQMGGSTNVRGSNNWIIDSGTFMYAAAPTGGVASVTQKAGPWPSPGALTLGTQANHSHGTPSSSLANFVFAYADVIFGSKNAPAGSYTDLTNQFHTGDIINFDPFQTMAFNDAYNKGNLMPGGSVMIWGQPSAPAGWTRVAGLNDRTLRAVSGTGGGTGGTQLISSGVSLAHTHTLPTVADHTHSLPNHQHALADGSSSSTGVTAATGFGFISDYGGGTLFYPAQIIGLTPSNQTCYQTRTNIDGGGNIGSAGGHSHDLVSALTSFVLAYVDVIQCSKDSGGEPYSYTDMTAIFGWKKLVSYQRLNNLAKNDAMIQYHTTPTASQALFFMASPPAGWNKITAQHDKALRIVDGGTGGSTGGGSQLLSSTITFGHAHTVVAQPDHTHVDSHTHVIANGTQSVVQAGLSVVDHTGLSAGNPGNIQAGGHSVTATTPGPDSQPAAAGTHSHGGVTDSLLANVVLAYCDVIWCSKS